MKYEIKVEDMMCHNCVKRITSVLESLNVQGSCDLQNKIVTVDCDENKIQSIVDEIYDLGFTPILQK